jgi:hypothetical protein
MTLHPPTSIFQNDKKTAVSDNHDHDHNLKRYEYRYFYVRHYDKEVYQEQKKNGIKWRNGERECGPFKDSAFPKDVIEQFVKTKEAKSTDS